MEVGLEETQAAPGVGAEASLGARGLEETQAAPGVGAAEVSAAEVSLVARGLEETQAAGIGAEASLGARGLEETQAATGVGAVEARRGVWGGEETLVAGASPSVPIWAGVGGESGQPETLGIADELVRGASIGRFTVLRTLGAGGMGVVYAAYDPELDRNVALKLIRGSSDEASGGAR